LGAIVDVRPLVFHLVVLQPTRSPSSVYDSRSKRETRSARSSSTTSRPASPSGTVSPCSRFVERRARSFTSSVRPFLSLSSPSFRCRKGTALMYVSFRLFRWTSRHLGCSLVGVEPCVPDRSWRSPRKRSAGTARRRGVQERGFRSRSFGRSRLCCSFHPSLSFLCSSPFHF
jgi:hypothetical protein